MRVLIISQNHQYSSGLAKHKPSPSPSAIPLIPSFMGAHERPQHSRRAFWSNECSRESAPKGLALMRVTFSLEEMMSIAGCSIGM